MKLWLIKINFPKIAHHVANNCEYQNVTCSPTLIDTNRLTSVKSIIYKLGESWTK